MAANIGLAITERHIGAEVTMVALATSGKTLEFTGKDDKTAIILINSASSAANVTIEAGTGIQGVTDLVVSVPANSKPLVLRLDSGEFKKVDGANKGYIVLKGATTISAGAVELCE